MTTAHPDSGNTGDQNPTALIDQALKAAQTVTNHQVVTNPKHTDEDTILVNPEGIKETVGICHKHFPFLMDVCGADYPERKERLEVIYHFYNPESNRRLRVKTKVPDGQPVDSVTSIYKSANWFERETYDLFGIQFADHPDLRRILTHQDFDGHALRKDYPADKNQELKTQLEHTYATDKKRLMPDDDDHLSDRVWINIGPAHPATHGTLRLMAVLSGETVEKCDLEIGYLHRCFEKMCETHNYNQIIPYTDRLNYCSAPLNNNAWCRAVEKMMGIEVPDRTKVIRVILDEFSRIIDHIVCVCTNAVDLGALTNFWLGFQAREKVYALFEKLCGARLTVSLARIGGLGFDLPKGWVEDAKAVLEEIKKCLGEVDSLLTRNRIFVQRMSGAAPISKEDAINWGFTGPALRAAGVPYDLRVSAPYDLYDQFEFDVPIGHRGDCYDRYSIRMEEIRQSTRILEQALNNIPSGPIKCDDPNVSLPNKEDVYGNIEGLMNQFMLVVHGVQPPPGEIYQASEGANGELGFYIVSDGSGIPYRVKCRPPCFAVLQAVPGMVEGQMLADAIACIGTINFIAGELDR